MNVKSVAAALLLVGSALSSSKAIAQNNMKNGYLNVQMRTDLCAQNWPGAIQVIETMKRISPKDRPSLEQYQALLVNFRENNTRIPAWPSSAYCSGSSNALPSPTATTDPNPNPPPAAPTTAPPPTPGTRTDTVPTF